ncbi:FAD/NAD(P)-binding protein [Kitasatospora sp. NPDC048194]|uniref:FAD/NAD(P)-binding protein n=1 Tax=Kitasatospora sp. NPDC048194 TaxID=3364045 RepID=UPI00371DC040
MDGPAHRRRQVTAVVGAGAAGTLVTLQLCEAAAAGEVPWEVRLIDPAPDTGRGTAYRTEDPRHLLNVPAGGMSAYPDDPSHFVDWCARQADGDGTAPAAADFLPRAWFGAYLDDALGEAVGRATARLGDSVRVSRVRARVVDLRWSPDPAGPALLLLDDGSRLRADGVVLATGPDRAPNTGLPEGLRESARFLPDPWAPGALRPLLTGSGPGAVLLLGTGLTAVDVAIRADRPGRVLHAVSRNGRLPRPHAPAPLPPLAPPELLARPTPGQPLAALRASLARHVRRAARLHGDWRPAVDGLRPVTSRLWQALSDPDRAEFLRRDSSLWNVHRHRMPPETARTVDRLRQAGRLRVSTGRPVDCREDGDGLTVTLDDGRELSVAWVVDCRGPGLAAVPGADPLRDALLATGRAVPGPLGIGLRTDGGRLLGADGSAALPFWTLGAVRRGELWESTAIPEIRVQAAEIARRLLAERSAGNDEGAGTEQQGGERVLLGR